MHRRIAIACSFALTMVALGAAKAEELPTFRIEAKDGRLQPSALHVPAGKRIKIEIVNLGAEPIEFESLELRKEKVLAPGARSFVVIAPLRHGIYPFFDDFHPETGRGALIAE
jgi:hypothetical protein